MIELNLNANCEEQEIIKNYLQENVSEILAEKINNGVKIMKDNKVFINKKDLDSFWQFATNEAQKLAEKGAGVKVVKDETVFSWAIHYFEEDSIEGKLYNEDGTEYKPVIAKPTLKIEIKAQPKKVENKQATLFDLFLDNDKIQEKVESKQNQRQVQIIESDGDKAVIDTNTGEILSRKQHLNEFEMNNIKKLKSMFNDKIKIIQRS